MGSLDGAARVAVGSALVLGAAATLAAQPEPAAGSPEQAYVGYLMAVHGDNAASVDAFLGPQALEQLRALPEIGRRNAIHELRMLGLTEPPRVVKVESKGERVVLHLAATVDEDRVVRGGPTPVRPIEMTGQVELTRRGTAFTVDSEHWRSADGSKSWSGLVAPGVFRAELVKPDPTGWATADIRAVVSAEAFYQSLDNGYHGPLTCLAEPGKCIAGQSMPAMLASEVTSLQPRYGFRRRFDAGPKAPAKEVGPGKASRTSITSYAYWIIPESPAAGLHSRCGDASGVICEMPDATAPAATGTCPAAAACTPIR